MPARVPIAQIIQADANAWLEANPAAAHSSIITSLPDVSELPELGLSGWRDWFIDSARRVIAWLPETGVAIFYQSDIRHRGAWIDKSHLVLSAMDAQGAQLLWHTIVCRRPAGSLTMGRASYSHMLCVSRSSQRARAWAGPHVLPDAGPSSWSRGMGQHACELACRYLQRATDTRLVLDPFCGHGAVLRAANALGFDVIGIDVSSRRCRTARRALMRT